MGESRSHVRGGGGCDDGEVGGGLDALNRERRSEYCGGSSTIPSSLGRGSSSSTSVCTINRDGARVDDRAMAAFR